MFRLIKYLFFKKTKIVVLLCVVEQGREIATFVPNVVPQPTFALLVVNFHLTTWARFKALPENRIDSMRSVTYDIDFPSQFSFVRG